MDPSNANLVPTEYSPLRNQSHATVSFPSESCCRVTACLRLAHELIIVHTSTERCRVSCPSAVKQLAFRQKQADTMLHRLSRSSRRTVATNSASCLHYSVSSLISTLPNISASNYTGASMSTKLRSTGTRNFVTSRSLFAAAITSVPMPSLSPTMTHGTISAWLKKPGDDMKAGDVLCDIETDKASVGFEIQEESVLAKILVEALGPELPCGEAICYTVEDQEAYAEFLKMDAATYPSASAPTSKSIPAALAVAVASAQAISDLASVGNQKFSPAARHLLQSSAVDSSGIIGTSKGGLISKQDVILAMKSGKAKAGTAAKQTAHTAAPASIVAQAVKVPSPAVLSAPAPAYVAPAFSAQSIDLTEGPPVNSRFTDIPNSNMRKIIAKRLTESKSTVPHFYSSIECEIDDLMALRKSLKKDLDVNVSVNDLVIKSAALALRDVPEANAKWNRLTGVIDMGSGVDISVAVATPNGLITPIVTGADRRGLAGINMVVKDLAGRAKEGKLKPEEFQGGSFSVSNLGMFGISSFTAVINPPQACILAVGAGIPRVFPPKVLGDKPRVVTTVTVQLSGDRRVVDEALAAQFLQVFRSYLSNPKSMLL